MTSFYYFVCIVTAIEAFACAFILWYVNRRRSFGLIFGLAAFFFGIWTLGFAHYFRPHTEADALFWAKVTLTGSVADSVFYFVGIAYLLGIERRIRELIYIALGLAAVFCGLIWAGVVIEGIKPQPQLDDHVCYNRRLYPLLSLQIVFWVF